MVYVVDHTSWLWLLPGQIMSPCEAAGVAEEWKLKLSAMWR